MFRAVHEMLNSHQNVWSGTPAFEEAFTAFSEQLSLLIQNGQKQKTVRLGIARAKNKLVQQSLEEAYILAGVLKAYAVTIGDPVLSAKSDWNPTMLKKGSMEVVVGRLKELAELFLEHQSAMADYGVEASDIEGFVNHLAEHESIITAPLHARNEGALITRMIKVTILEIQQILTNRIDPQVRVLDKDNPEFAAKYFKAREEVDPIVHHMKEDDKDLKNGANQNPDRDDGDPHGSAA